MRTDRQWSKLALTLGVVAAAAAGTTQAQLTFSGALDASGSTNAALEIKTSPAVVLTPDGSTFMVWQDLRGGIGGDILSSRHVAGSASFSQPVLINDDEPSPEPDWGWSHGLPDIAAGPEGNLYIVWEDRRDATGNVCPAAERCDADIWLTRSTNGGLTWSPSIRLHAVVEGGQSQPAIAVDDAGRVHVAWTDARAGAEDSDIYYTRSVDLGVSFATPRRLNNASSIGVQFEPAIAASGDRVYVAWSDKRNGNYDIYSTQSADGGVTFVGNVRANDDESALDQRAPAVAVAADEGAVVVWRDPRAGYEDPDIYMAHNVDGGPAFGTNVRVNDDLDGAVQTDPDVVVDFLGRPVVFYTDYRNGLLDPDIYASIATTGAPPFTFAPAVRVNVDTNVAKQRRPDATLNPVTGEVVVAWEHMRRSGGADIKVAHTLN